MACIVQSRTAEPQPYIQVSHSGVGAQPTTPHQTAPCFTTGWLASQFLKHERKVVVLGQSGAGFFFALSYAANYSGAERAKLGSWYVAPFPGGKGGTDIWDLTFFLG
jgi:hypothetical protein